MSSHYSASQYNDSFAPKRLRNWQLGTKGYPGRLAWPRRCPTCFIAFDNGHLFPNVSKNCCTSPWGDYRAGIWDEKIPCACIDALRHPQDYKKAPNLIMVTMEQPFPQIDSQIVCDLAKKRAEKKDCKSNEDEDTKSNCSDTKSNCSDAKSTCSATKSSCCS